MTRKKDKVEYVEVNEATKEVLEQYPILGKKVRDVVTGVEGVAVAVLVNLFGCNQIGVSSKVKKDGSRESTVYIDDGRVKVLGDAVKGRVHKEKKVRSGPDFNSDAPRGRF